jgi:hypothetical protein
MQASKQAITPNNELSTAHVSEKLAPPSIIIISLTFYLKHGFAHHHHRLQPIDYC